MPQTIGETIEAKPEAPDLHDQVANERRQSFVRLTIAAFLYVPITIYFLLFMEDGYTPILAVAIVVFAVSIPLHLMIVRRPGVYHWRRWLAMLHDYGATSAAMIFGGKTLLILFAVLLWITVGYGLRYGQRYLIAATIAALTSIGVVTWASPVWRAEPEMVAALVLTTIIVPAYVYLLQSRVQHAYQATIEATRAKSIFLAQASHDLRQPIHAISLLTACLRDGNLGSSERRMVDNIDKSLQSVSRLFRSLLDISTLESGKVAPKYSATRIADIFDDLRRQNTETARWAEVDLRFVRSKLIVRTDPDLLTTMIQNLISNALKFAPGRRVVVGPKRRGGDVDIMVCDGGPGIDPEELRNVFDEFYQVRTLGAKDTDGVGLGLSIVARLTKLMDLRVSIKSELGSGTAVTISGLRTMRGDVLPRRSAAHNGGQRLSGFRVVLVEDDPNSLHATAVLLRRWGCVVEEHAAIPPLSCPCDLIVTDFDLGEGVTGRECINQIRALNRENTAAIVITAHDESRVRALLDDPQVLVLAKPLAPAELRSAILTQKVRSAA